MSSCFGGLGGISLSRSDAVWAFEPDLLRVKLSLRRRELPKEEEVGSTELVVSKMEPSSLEAFRGFCNLGPVNLPRLSSLLTSIGLEASRRKKLNSPLVFGRDEETNGDIAVLLLFAAYDSGGFGTVVLELLGARLLSGLVK